MEFISHGYFKVTLIDEIVFFNGVGPWNKESIDASRKEFSFIHKKLVGKKWGVIAKLQGESIYTPEAINILMTAIKIDQENGRVISAFIVENSDCPTFTRSHIINIFENVSEPVKFFKNEFDAKSWMNSYLRQLN